MATHTGRCGRCQKPTGTRWRQFCDRCRYDKVKVVNARNAIAKIGVPQPKRKPQPVRFVVPVMPPQVASRPWWIGLDREQMQAVMLAELPRMAASKYGRVRGGLAQDIW